MFLVEVLLLDLLHVLRTQQARDVVQNEALVAACADPGLAEAKSCTICRGVVHRWSRSIATSISSDVMPPHVGRLKNVKESRTDSSSIGKLFQQEDTGTQPCLGVLMIDL